MIGRGAGSHGLAPLVDHLVGVAGLAPDPPDPVGTRNRVVRLEDDPVAVGFDDLDPRAWRLAVVVGELDQRLRYSRHAFIVTSPRTLGRSARGSARPRSGV